MEFLFEAIREAISIDFLNNSSKYIKTRIFSFRPYLLKRAIHPIRIINMIILNKLIINIRVILQDPNETDFKIKRSFADRKYHDSKISNNNPPLHL